MTDVSPIASMKCAYLSEAYNKGLPEGVFDRVQEELFSRDLGAFCIQMLDAFNKVGALMLECLNSGKELSLGNLQIKLFPPSIVRLEEYCMNDGTKKIFCTKAKNVFEASLPKKVQDYEKKRDEEFEKKFEEVRARHLEEEQALEIAIAKIKKESAKIRKMLELSKETNKKITKLQNNIDILINLSKKEKPHHERTVVSMRSHNSSDI